MAWKQRHPSLLDEDYPKASAGYGGTTRGIDSFSDMHYLVKMYSDSRPVNPESSEYKWIF